MIKEISLGCSLEGMMLKLNSSTLTISCEELTHWKTLWGWEGFGVGGNGDDRVWDEWMVSLTQWTWVWVNSGSWWWTGRPGVLRFMGSQRVRHNWATELNWIEQHFKEFPDGSDGKACAYSEGDQVRSLDWEDPLEKEMATTPVLLPGKSHGWRTVVGYSPWGLKELDRTEQLHFHFSQHLKGIIPCPLAPRMNVSYSYSILIPDL